MKYFDLVFTGDIDSCDGQRFVECEDDTGKSFLAGEWSQRNDGTWQLRVLPTVFQEKEAEPESSAPCVLDCDVNAGG